MMTIHFQADLRPIVKDRVGMLHWITDPACSGFIIAYSLSGDQVLISNFDVSDLTMSQTPATNNCVVRGTSDRLVG